MKKIIIVTVLLSMLILSGCGYKGECILMEVEETGELFCFGCPEERTLLPKGATLTCDPAEGTMPVEFNSDRCKISKEGKCVLVE